jgi:hypothetical protein
MSPEGVMSSEKAGNSPRLSPIKGQVVSINHQATYKLNKTNLYSSVFVAFSKCVCFG